MSDVAPLPVLEWSTGQVRAYDPVLGRTAVGSRVSEVAGHISGKRVIVALSRQTSFVRSTRLPDVPKLEMLKILALQVGRLLPIEPADTAIDLLVLDDKTSEGRLVVVSAVRTEVLREVLDEVARAGLTATCVVPAALSSMAVCKDNGIADGAVVGLTSEGMTIDLIQHGGLRSSRLVPALPDAESTLTEVGRSFGAAGLPQGPVTTVGRLDLPGATNTGSDPLAALSHSGFQMSLELPEVKAKRTHRQVQKRKNAALLLWVGAVAVSAYVFSVRSDKNSAVQKNETEWTARLSGLRDENAQAKSKMALLKSQKDAIDLAFSPKQPLGDVVTVLSNLTPNQLWLTGISVERGKRATLRGTALTSQAVTAYLSSLGKQSRMRDVKLVFANNALLEATPVVNFSISTHVVGNLPLPDEKSAKGGSK